MASGLFSCSGVWGIFPDQGSKPMSPELASEFSSIAPPGKSLTVSLYFYKFKITHMVHIILLLDILV